MTKHRPSRSATVLLAAGLMALAGLAQAAPSRNVDALKLQYEREKADCMTGQSQQPRNVCLREAQAAYAQARQGQLAPRQDSADQWQANALQRCQRHPPEDRAMCERRVREGEVSGSVKGGGQLRTLTVREPQSPPPPPAR